MNKGNESDLLVEGKGNESMSAQASLVFWFSETDSFCSSVHSLTLTLVPAASPRALAGAEGVKGRRRRRGQCRDEPVPVTEGLAEGWTEQ